MEFLCDKTLVRKNKEEVSANEALQDKEVIAFYFSAHWCPPCRMFTPVLADFYKEVMDESLPIEIVFLSSDSSADAMFEYMNEAHGDWLAVPHGSPVVSEMAEKFEVEGIPTLIVLKKDGTVVTKDGDEDVRSKGPQVAKEWLK